MAKKNGSSYTSKIIKVGALLDDTKLLLADWDITQSVKINLAHILKDNILGKASRSRIKDILVVMRERYFQYPDLVAGLKVCLETKNLSRSVDSLLYYYSAKNDSLLYDTVTIFIEEKKHQRITEIDVPMMVDWVTSLVDADKTTTRWDDYTILRCSRGLLSTLRDFGLLEGTNEKRLAPIYLTLEAFAFLAFHKYLDGSSGERIISDPDWKLFSLSEKMVERYFMEAHQHHLLEYYSAGSVIRISFPCSNLEEYARVIAQTTY